MLLTSPKKTIASLWFLIICLNIIAGGLSYHIVMPFFERYWEITWHPLIVQELIELYFNGSIMSLMFWYALLKPLGVYQNKLLQMSVTDAMTGLYNRRYLMEFLNKELQMAQRHPDYNCALVMIDVDNFKNVNDHYGHDVGDKLLIEVASILKARTRIYSISARYGGDEFIMVVPKADEKAVEGLVANLRKDLKSIDIVPVTVSVGMALVPTRAICTPEDWITMADVKLYMAKSSEDKGKL